MVVSTIDVSATGSQFKETPLVIPTREHLDWVKMLMVGDTYIGRGSRQRNLPKSRFCNVYKVSQYGRSAAITNFRQYLQRTRDLRVNMDAFWMPIALPLYERAGLPRGRNHD